jgi:chromosome segregation ATPase
MNLSELKERLDEERQAIHEFYREVERNSDKIDTAAAEVARIQEAIEEVKNGRNDVQGRRMPGEE